MASYKRVRWCMHQRGKTIIRLEAGFNVITLKFASILAGQIDASRQIVFPLPLVVFHLFSPGRRITKPRWCGTINLAHNQSAYHRNEENVMASQRPRPANVPEENVYTKMHWMIVVTYIMAAVSVAVLIVNAG